MFDKPGRPRLHPLDLAGFPRDTPYRSEHYALAAISGRTLAECDEALAEARAASVRQKWPPDHIEIAARLLDVRLDPVEIPHDRKHCETLAGPRRLFPGRVLLVELGGKKNLWYGAMHRDTWCDRNNRRGGRYFASRKKPRGTCGDKRTLSRVWRVMEALGGPVDQVAVVVTARESTAAGDRRPRTLDLGVKLSSRAILAPLLADALGEALVRIPFRPTGEARAAGVAFPPGWVWSAMETGGGLHLALSAEVDGAKTKAGPHVFAAGIGTDAAELWEAAVLGRRPRPRAPWNKRGPPRHRPWLCWWRAREGWFPDFVVETMTEIARIWLDNQLDPPLEPGESGEVLL